jgi:hypothetical protein
MTVYMNNDNELMDKVSVFLIVLVSLILVFSQYQFYKLMEGSIWIYVSGLMILALIGLVAWMFMSKKSDHVHHSKDIFKVPRSEPKPWSFMEKISYGMVALVALMILFNQAQISQASAFAGLSDSKLKLSSKSTKTPVLTGDPIQDAMAIVIPTGTPFYGEDLGVSFDDPITGLSRIAELDPAYGRAKVQLEGEDQARYIRINTIPKVTCEFCCGVDTGVTSTGRPTCGCKHAWATRGLSAYLIKNYPDLSDEEIVSEVAKWKGLFFPKQMIARYMEQSQTGQYTPDIAGLLLNLDEDAAKKAIESVKTASHGQSTGSLPSSLDNLPSMVGGC